MKLKEIEVNQRYELTLVVKSATARETKAGKPYLNLELYDGNDTISANYWDWSSGQIPPVNEIVDVKCQVTEWQGIKQLTIKSMSANTRAHLSEFMPTGGMDIAEVYKDAYSLASSIKDDALRELSLGIFESLRGLWLIAPGANSVHHAYVGGNLVHSYSVAKLAKVIAENTDGANVDLCVAGALLHDIGKLFAYTANGISMEMTYEGKLYGHIFIGAEFVGNYAESILDTNNGSVAAKIHLLKHIILAHHGKMEYGSPVTPTLVEAFIVHEADAIDATVEQIRQASRKLDDAVWTDRIYTLGNKPHLTTQYVEYVMEQ